MSANSKKDPHGHVLRIAVASDLHAYADTPSGMESPSKLQVPAGSVSPLEHPGTGLLALIQKEGLRADLLLSPGDLTFQADPKGLDYAWRLLHEAGVALGVQLTTGTVGNHDVASRGRTDVEEARDLLRRLRPLFPLPERSSCDQYWARNYAIWSGIGATLVLLNTCPLHTIGNKSEFERGLITAETLKDLHSDLQEIPGNHLHILLCHHHPQSHSELQLGETDVMVRGQLLLNTLELHGDWLVIHGHKHHPKITYAAGGARSPVVFGAGSFSGNFGTAAETATRNQFYIAEIYRPTSSPGLRGKVYSWNWAFGRGWMRSVGSTTGLPAKGGFGCRRHPDRLADQIAATLSGSGAISWSVLCAKVQDLAFLLPSDYELVKNALLKRYRLEILDDQGCPAEVGVSRERQ